MVTFETKKENYKDTYFKTLNYKTLTDRVTLILF